MKRSRSPPTSSCAFSAQYSSELCTLYHFCIWPLLGRYSALVLHRSRRCFHYISTCSQFARTDSCLLLRRRQSENIEPAHSTERQHHRHNSDSSEKVLDEQSLRPTFYFSSNISAAKKVLPRLRWSAGIWMNGINGNPCCQLLLKDGILKQATEWLIMPMCFLEVILIGVVRGKLLCFYHLTKLSLYWHCRSDA